MQRRHHIGTAGRRRIRDGALDEPHAVEATLRRDALRGLDQIVSRLDGDDRAAPLFGEEQVVEHETEIGFPGAQIGQHRLGLRRERAVQRRLYQLRQVQHLFQLAPRIRVQRAVAREDMQRLEQRHRLPRPQFRYGIAMCFLARLLRHATSLTRALLR